MKFPFKLVTERKYCCKWPSCRHRLHLVLQSCTCLKDIDLDDDDDDENFISDSSP